MSELIDLATEKPGPMGWGEEGYSDRFGAEHAYLDKYAERDPFFYARNPAKSVRDEETFAKIIEIHKANGIDGGLWLSLIESLVFGDQLAWKAQIVGSCVGSSFMRGATVRTLWESFVLGDPEEIWGTKIVGPDNVAPFGPYGYRAGRKLANINRGDGSYCSVQIRGAKEYGILPCSTPGLGDYTDAFPEPQNGSTYREWGNSNSLLSKFQSVAQKFTLQESEQVRDAETAKLLITEHCKPLQICSMWAFTPHYTHSSWKLGDGSPVVIYKRDMRTSWAHAMMIMGVVQAGGEWFAIVQNSWGQRAHKNGDFFVIELAVLAYWLRDAECMSIGDIELADNVLPGDVA